MLFECWLVNCCNFALTPKTQSRSLVFLTSSLSGILSRSAFFSLYRNELEKNRLLEPTRSLVSFSILKTGSFSCAAHQKLYTYPGHDICLSIKVTCPHSLHYVVRLSRSKKKNIGVRTSSDLAGRWGGGGSVDLLAQSECKHTQTA